MTTTTLPEDFSHEDHALMAAMVFKRFGRNHEQAREAWTRLLQNPGWDNTAYAKTVWEEMVEQGLRALGDCGW